MGLRNGVNIIKVEGDFENCPGERIKPIIQQYSDWEGTFQICEQYNGAGNIVYDKSIPLVTFHSEGDMKWIDLDYFLQYGTVLHCNPYTAREKGTFFNYWAFDYLFRIHDYKIMLNRHNSFSKKFLCLNGNRAPHRYYTIQKLFDEGLFDKGLISLLNRYNSIEIRSHYEKFKQLYNGDTSFVDDLIKKKKILELDRTNEQIHKDDRSHNEWIYNQTSVSLVTETYGDAARKVFITEKSYKPIANCHFPIWIACPRTVEFFRTLGFDMFDDVIDHSYDTREDDATRYDMAINSLKNFLNSIDTLDKDALQARLEKNQRKYLNMRISKEEVNSWL